MTFRSATPALTSSVFFKPPWRVENTIIFDGGFSSKPAKSIKKKQNSRSIILDPVISVVPLVWPKDACNMRFESLKSLCPNNGTILLLHQDSHVKHQIHSNDAYEQINYVSNS